MTIMTEQEAADRKKNVQDVCLLLFPNYQFIITPRGVVFREKKENGNLINIDENNFIFLQEKISMVSCFDRIIGNKDSFNPVDAKAKEIAEKLLRGR